MASVITLISCYIAASFGLSLLEAEDVLQRAMYWERRQGQTVQCRLCPRNCVIPEGSRGFCRVRENRGGTLYSLVYGRPVSLHIDPIEKKPLFHFLPGTAAFSIATAGCNLRCKFCQNWEISQARPEDVRSVLMPPAQLVEEVKRSGSPTIAYTYTEPAIFYEYMLDTARLAQAAGIRNVMHSSGYINEEPLRELAPYMDAANIDLKGCSEEYYAQLSQGTLAPVQRTLKILQEEGVWIEITNLLVPGYNDDVESVTALCRWITENLGTDVPVHFSRFFPLYKLSNLNPTPVEHVQRAAGIARRMGIKYVYIGNIAGNPAEDTFCPASGRKLIDRRGYFIVENHIAADAGQAYCGEKIAGVWE
ncbi:MAG: AmmeMemoRadiSam system radical SAM enzyme [Candidatus Omnitrophica bacterium]|nr:AmmeMemoRadiSam system radical SAM enzyme [Candidatus Omnitrophota bacterium]